MYAILAEMGFISVDDLDSYRWEVFVRATLT